MTILFLSLFPEPKSWPRPVSLLRKPSAVVTSATTRQPLKPVVAFQQTSSTELPSTTTPRPLNAEKTRLPEARVGAPPPFLVGHSVLHIVTVAAWIAVLLLHRNSNVFPILILVAVLMDYPVDLHIASARHKCSFRTVCNFIRALTADIKVQWAVSRLPEPYAKLVGSFLWYLDSVACDRVQKKCPRTGRFTVSPSFS